MSIDIATALRQGGISDMTTVGRKTGRPRRIEIYFHNLDGDLYITGKPGRRGWYANLLDNPQLTLHLKEGLQADVVASAEPVTDGQTRRAVLWRLLTERFDISVGKAAQMLDTWVTDSPLVKVTPAV
ncbi:MAG: nitroreductase/quinone reductase family protein [Acidimicrobiia bacterium]